MLLEVLDGQREDDRALLIYRYFLDLSEAEMAEALACSPGTVKSRLSRALARLRELGEVEVRTEVEDIPGRLEVDAYREEVDIEHEPIGQVVAERDQPWEENGAHPADL